MGWRVLLEIFLKSFLLVEEYLLFVCVVVVIVDVKYLVDKIDYGENVFVVYFFLDCSEWC